MTNFAVASVALATMVQFCPAPFLAGIGAAVAANIGTISGVVGAASGVAGTVIGGVNGKRDIPLGFSGARKSMALALPGRIVMTSLLAQL